jgi:hypothetical protein
MPKDFTAMSDLDLAAKYPSTKKPLAMYTSEDRNTDFGVNASKRSFPSNDIEMLQKFYKANILEAYTANKNSNFNVRAGATFLSEGVREVNGRKFAFYEFKSEYDGIRRYSYIQLTLIKEHIYVFNFSTDQSLQKAWQPAVEKMMNSIKLSDNISLPAQEKYETKNKKLINPKNKNHEKY